MELHIVERAEHLIEILDARGLWDAREASPVETPGEGPFQPGRGVVAAPEPIEDGGWRRVGQ
jgi:hypothetical protein